MIRSDIQVSLPWTQTWKVNITVDSQAINSYLRRFQIAAAAAGAAAAAKKCWTLTLEPAADAALRLRGSHCQALKANFQVQATELMPLWSRGPASL
jgi:hypothetical protein